MWRKTLLLLGFNLCAAAQATELHTRGWIEHARIMPDRLLMTAKLDSGAKTTSIHAEILTNVPDVDSMSPEALAEFLNESEDAAMEMMGTKMVNGEAPDDPPAAEIAPISAAEMQDMMPETITFRLTSRGGKERIYTAPVSRWVSIRRRGGGSFVRPVVMMELCIAGRRVNGEVNLADRSGFNYPLLIGRNMLGDAAITVDSRQIFASKKACPPAKD
ncbi:MAG: RimK/LysX family protein [Henriciella sp.]